LVRPVGDIPDDRGDPLVGEAEPDPHQVLGVDHPAQHPPELAGIGTPIIGGGQHHGLGAVVVAVREQHGQFVVAERLPGAPAVHRVLVRPGY
jgi:hypothetical protein